MKQNYDYNHKKITSETYKRTWIKSRKKLVNLISN